MELESISPLGRCQDWPGYVNQESIYQTMFTKVTFSFHFYQIFIVFSYQTDMSIFIIGWRGRLQNTDTRYLHFLLTFTNTSEDPFSVLCFCLQSQLCMNMNIYNNRADVSVDVQWLMVIVFLLQNVNRKFTCSNTMQMK